MIGEPDLTALVKAVYLAAGHHPAAPPGVGILICDLFGDERVRLCARAQRATIEERRDGWSVRVPRDLRGDALVVGLALALANWELERAQHGGAAPWLAAELAACIMLPTPALQILHDILGYDVEQIASMWAIPRRIVAVRLRDVFAPGTTGPMLRLDVT